MSKALSLISIKNGNQMIIASIDDIIWIESHEQFSYIKLKGTQHKNNKYITKNSLKKLELQLCLRNPELIRVSKFFIVNMKAVKTIEKTSTDSTSKKTFLKFKDDDQEVFIGRGYKKKLKELFIEI